MSSNTVFAKKRVFVAPTIREMNPWVQHIKYIIDSFEFSVKICSKLISMGFSEDVSSKAALLHPNDIKKAINHVLKTTTNESSNTVFDNEQCKFVDTCKSAQRILDMLQYYQQNNNTELMEYLVSYASNLIQDYHHVLEKHLNQDTMPKIEIDYNFELFHNQMLKRNIKICSYVECEKCKQKQTYYDDDLALQIDALDCVHYFFIHSNFVSDKHCNDDQEVQPLQQIVPIQRNRLFRRNGLYQSESKKQLVNEKTDEINKVSTDQENQVVEYSYGECYDYWSRFSDHTKKYNSFKSELTQNTICNVDIDEFSTAYNKSILLLNHSNHLKKMQSIKCNKYGIEAGLSLTPENVMSIMFYTDFDKLSYNLSKTFRRITPNESQCSVKQRNRQYWHWCKKLIETVKCYGMQIEDSEVDIFYHGISKVYFKDFVAQFNSPLSTTTNKQIAISFAEYNDGIVLGLTKYEGSGSLRYFNCSFISRFSGEEERLFIYCKPNFLKIDYIYDLSADSDYQEYVKAIGAFEEIIKSELCISSTENALSQNIEIVQNLMECVINKNLNHNYPAYIVKSFNQWTDQRTSVSIDLSENHIKNAMYGGILSCLVHKDVDNLLLFDKIASLFKHASVIYCQNTGSITASYIRSLLKILDAINSLEFSTLNKIELWQINFNINHKYTPLFKQKRWTISQISDGVQKLILERTTIQQQHIVIDENNEIKQTIDINNRQRAALSIKAWNDHIHETSNILWIDGIVPYIISFQVTDGLRQLIKMAISDFNTMTPVQWISYNPRMHDNYVEFRQNNAKCCYSEKIGRKQGKGLQFIRLPYPRYPNSITKTRKICVMHEMMHTIGFGHEFCRSDQCLHCRNNKQAQFSHKYVKFGKYDYKSIMQYQNYSDFTANNKEYARSADKSPTFSQGDLAAIRRIYGKKPKNKIGKVHFGEWHRKCSHECTPVACVCGNCGKLPGGVDCGYIGMNGHWTCCMNEIYDSSCHPTHTSFWHKKCTSPKCTDKRCHCGSCGGGCTYTGNSGHWSCCNNQRFNSHCSNAPYGYMNNKVDIVLIGDANVGKTSLMRRYINDTFDDDTINTVGIDRMQTEEILHHNKVMEITVHDTAGQEKFHSVGATYYRKADVIFVCFDVTNEMTFNNCSKWREQIKEYADDKVIVFLVGCKHDLSKDDIKRFVVEDDVIYRRCSSKTGENVYNIFVTAVEMVFDTRKDSDENTNPLQCIDVDIVPRNNTNCCIHILQSEIA